MKNKKTRRICIAIIFLGIVINLIVWGYPILNENQCRNRVYSDLEEEISDDVQSANFRIAIGITQKADNVSSNVYGEIGCGVIFDHKDGFYYALTAAHVVDGKTEFETGITLGGDEDEDEEVSKEYYMIPYGTLTYEQASEESETHISLEDYYTAFASFEVVYVSATNDIAIVRFQSDDNYGSLALADEDPLKGDKIAVFGKDDETGSAINYGKVISDKYESFDASDGRPADQVLKHNAYEKPGYSGGAAINEEMKIAGINIGGGTNAMGKFWYGVMIPVNIVKEVVEEWKEE